MFRVNLSKIILVSLMLGLPVTKSVSQILSDPVLFKNVEKGVNYIYNLQFDEALEQFDIIKKKYPNHPANLLLSSMVTYWKNFPLVPDSPYSDGFQKDLRRCIELCEIKNPPDEAEYLLTNLCARGVLLLYLSDNGLHKDVMPLAKNTYKYLRRAFDFKDKYNDFYFFTGLYNYYREVYPEFHPIYKTFIFIFPKGDRQLGLKEIQTAAGEAVLLKAESTTFLTYIYQNYEKNIPKSTLFSKTLLDLYPVNMQFLTLYIKSLLLEGDFDLAELMIKRGLENPGNSYFRAVFTICNGIVQEKKYRNYAMAQQYYFYGIKEIEVYGSFSSDYDAYAYFGLSRISAHRNDDKSERYYRKRATDLLDEKVDIFGEKR